MSSKIHTRFLTEADYPEWNRMVSSSTEGSIYSTPEYLDVLASETDGCFRILAAERGGELVGGIALFERRNRLGTYVAGRLLLYYNGFIFKAHATKYPSERTARHVDCMAALEEAIRALQYGRLRIKGLSLPDVRILLDRGWKAEPSYTYVVPLSNLDLLWSRIEQNLRRLVNRCEGAGIVFSEDDDIEHFLQLHERTLARKGTSSYLPAASFRRYYQRLRNQKLCALMQARTVEGRLISTQLVLLGSHRICHTVSAAADSEFLRTGATAFLRWNSFRRMADLGYQGNDLTDAQLNPVTHFKSQLGGDLEMKLVLCLPDSTRFRAHSAAMHAGALAKHGLKRLLESLPRPSSGSAVSATRTA